MVSAGMKNRYAPCAPSDHRGIEKTEGVRSTEREKVDCVSVYVEKAR
jgi:hypothetical protein